MDVFIMVHLDVLQKENGRANYYTLLNWVGGEGGKYLLGILGGGGEVCNKVLFLSLVVFFRVF